MHCEALNQVYWLVAFYKFEALLGLLVMSPVSEWQAKLSNISHTKNKNNR